ncbi:MFS transporter [Microlunatus soli]|uniref:Putative proline/betaine transporter n=1 Tax=Microlunatus soli TaxID=630515 RepID=A0A1H1U3W7_9ACTN|nr:MFS transporter [Microlunatus soli]SDS66589.1 Sugar transporter [Microlunatus soli]
MSTNPAAPRPTGRGYYWKATLSGLAGNTLELYDFLLYGTAASLYFPKLFFPEGNDFLSTLSSLATFAVGFIARPIGGLLIGRIGDRLGRKKALLITMYLMGACTIAIGLLPTYGSVGVLAPILLILVRILQGIAMGGEWGGSMVLVAESVPTHRRGFYSSIPNLGGFVSQFFVAGVMVLVLRLPEDAQLSYGWRIPFLLSLIVLIAGLWMRRNLVETPVFVEAQEQQQEHHSQDQRARADTSPLRERGPIGSLFIDHWREVLLMLGLRFSEGLPYFLLTVFAINYAKATGVDAAGMQTSILIMAAVAIPVTALYGHLSDKVGRRPIFAIGSAVVAITAFPFFLLLNTGSFWLITLGYILVLNLGHNLVGAVQPSLFAEMFPAKNRYSGVAGAREVSGIVTAGLTPFIAALLAGPDSTRWYLVAGYVVLGAVVSLIAIKIVPETRGRDLVNLASGSPVSPTAPVHSGNPADTTD